MSFMGSWYTGYVKWLRWAQEDCSPRRADAVSASFRVARAADTTVFLTRFLDSIRWQHGHVFCPLSSQALPQWVHLARPSINHRCKLYALLMQMPLHATLRQHLPPHPPPCRLASRPWGIRDDCA